MVCHGFSLSPAVASSFQIDPKIAIPPKKLSSKVCLQLSGLLPAGQLLIFVGAESKYLSLRPSPPPDFDNLHCARNASDRKLEPRKAWE